MPPLSRGCIRTVIRAPEFATRISRCAYLYTARICAVLTHCRLARLRALALPLYGRMPRITWVPGLYKLAIFTRACARTMPRCAALPALRAPRAPHCRCICLLVAAAPYCRFANAAHRTPAATHALSPLPAASTWVCRRLPPLAPRVRHRTTRCRCNDAFCRTPPFLTRTAVTTFPPAPLTLNVRAALCCRRIYLSSLNRTRRVTARRYTPFALRLPAPHITQHIPYACNVGSHAIPPALYCWILARHSLPRVTPLLLLSHISSFLYGFRSLCPHLPG